MNDESPKYSFDFDAHVERALSEYRNVRSDYEQFSMVAKGILQSVLHGAHIGVHSIEARAKSLESLSKKTAAPSDDDPSKPKYPRPLSDITDLAGVRVITFLPRTVEQACRCIEQEFIVLEKTDKAAKLMDEGKFGYQSIHFLAKMHSNRSRLPEYNRYRDLTLEIQVRTILQHAWAEMEHDIQYKSAAVIPTAVRRKFIALAGLLEIADREFQTLQDEDEQLREKARASVQTGQLSNVEITPDALKSYLDQRLGPDGRMSEWSYNYTANLLRRLGFTALSQIDQCISGYDDDVVSRAAWNSRQGQLSRFQETLLAAMGDTFIARHPWSKEYPDWLSRLRERLDRIRNAGIPVGSYDPAEHDPLLG